VNKIDPLDRPDVDAGQMGRLGDYAAIGLFTLAIFAVLKTAGDVIAPIVAAIFVGAILSRIAERLNQLGLPSVVANTLVVVCAVALGLLLIAGLAEPLASLVARAPDMARAVADMSQPLAQRLNRLLGELGHSHAGAPAGPGLGDAMGWITAFLGRLTPALEGLLIFFPCLAFFVAGRDSMRKQMVLAMPKRASRLSTLKTIAAVERALSQYFATTALVYASVGAVTGAIVLAFGLSQPLLWAVMTFALGYVPYIGVSLIALALTVAGLLTFQGLFALAPAALYLAAHLFSEFVIMPTLLGRRYEINPFLIFLAIVFWGWMWGPVGAILAVPLLVTAQTVADALMTEPDRAALP
jgi:predicted PurR-regulated permease PerM